MKSDKSNCYFCENEFAKNQLRRTGHGDKKQTCKDCRMKQRKTKLIKREE